MFLAIAAQALCDSFLGEGGGRGFDFDRQRCIDNYIVNFYCKDLMLAIEVDGSYHGWEEVSFKDDERQLKIESFGVTVIRFSEADMKNDMIK